MLNLSVAYYISEWVIRVVMLVVIVRQRRSPAGALSWLMVIFFLPWAGLVAYWLIGRHRLPRKRMEQHGRMLRHLDGLGSRLGDHPQTTHPAVDASVLPAVHLAERLGHMPILGGNATEMITSTPEFAERLVAEIDAAERHVHLIYYIYADDDTGRQIAEAAIRAARRGVSCRLLADAVGSWGFFGGLGRQMAEAGVDVRPAMPVGLFRRQFARLDLRNHRKLAVIDGKVGYTGSHNAVDASYGRKDMAWHDLTVRLAGPIVTELQAIFAADWYFETDQRLTGEDVFPPVEPAGEVAVQALPSGPNYPTENYQRLLVAALHAAERRVIMTTPYFIPDESFLRAIQSAALREVDVTLLLPEVNNKVVVGAASHAYFVDLLEAGVRVRLYRPGLLHAKTMSVDDEIAFIGTSNFDIRSFSLDFEINLLLYGPAVVGQLRHRQAQYIAESEEVDLAAWRRRPAIRQFGSGVAKLLSPLL